MSMTWVWLNMQRKRNRNGKLFCKLQTVEMVEWIVVFLFLKRFHSQSIFSFVSIYQCSYTTIVILRFTELCVFFGISLWKRSLKLYSQICSELDRTRLSPMRVSAFHGKFNDLLCSATEKPRLCGQWQCFVGFVIAVNL